MKRILHIPNYYPPHMGGIEQTASDIVKSLDGEFEQAVVCFASGKISSEEIVGNTKVYRIGYFAKVASQALSMEYKKTLKKVIKEFQPDYIHFHYPNPLVSHILLRLLKNSKAKLIVHWHLDILKNKLISGFFVNQNFKLLGIATKVIATSQNYVEGSTYLTLYKDKTVVIPSCMNEQRMTITDSEIDESKKIKEKYKDRIICLYLGRHVKHKGILKLIESAKNLDDRFILLIGGEGPITNQCKDIASVNPNIEFLGPIEDSSYRSYLYACDIFCFPSYTKAEAFGLAMTEAMYYEKPIVNFTIPGSGVNFVSINNKTGLEVENSNVDAYSEAITRLSDENLRRELGKNAKKRIMDNFTFKQFKEKILNFYKEIEEENNDN